MDFCTNCGGALVEDDAFCSECGVAVTVSPPVPRVTDTGQDARQDAEPLVHTVPAPEPASTPAPAGTGWWARRKAVVIGRVFLSGALVGVGLIVGWVAASDRSLVENESDAVAVEQRQVAADEALPMPDLRGLDDADARQILADLGVAAAAVTSKAEPAAGNSGIVIAQEPAYGYPVDGAVVLSTSEPARVPAFAGRDAETVLADLDDLGAEVEVVSRYTPSAAAGDVMSIDPKPGTVLPAAVVVVVAAEPDVANLTDVAAVEDNCYTDDDSMNGSRFTSMLVCESDRASYDQTWVVGRAAGRLTGVAGIPDGQDASTIMGLQILGDGRQLAAYRLPYGERPQRIDLDVTGVLRLTLRYQSLSPEYGALGVGRLQLLGDAASLATLERY